MPAAAVERKSRRAAIAANAVLLAHSLFALFAGISVLVWNDGVCAVILGWQLRV